MKIMQIGNFRFTQDANPKKVFIQVITTGEGGVFWWGDVPFSARFVLRVMRKGKDVAAKDLTQAATDMIEFWKRNF